MCNCVYHILKYNLLYYIYIQIVYSIVYDVHHLKLRIVLLLEYFIVVLKIQCVGVYKMFLLYHGSEKIVQNYHLYIYKYKQFKSLPCSTIMEVWWVLMIFLFVWSKEET